MATAASIQGIHSASGTMPVSWRNTPSTATHTAVTAAVARRPNRSGSDPA